MICLLHLMELERNQPGQHVKVAAHVRIIGYIYVTTHDAFHGSSCESRAGHQQS